MVFQTRNSPRTQTSKPTQCRKSRALSAWNPCSKRSPDITISRRPDVNARFDAFATKARAAFAKVLLNKEILNRSKKRSESLLVSLMKIRFNPDPDLSKVKAAFLGAQPAAAGNPHFKQSSTKKRPGSMLLSPGHLQIFSDFPAKSYFSHAATELNEQPAALVRTLCQALKLSAKEAGENKKLAELRDAIVAALSPSMWPRRI